MIARGAVVCLLGLVVADAPLPPPPAPPPPPPTIVNSATQAAMNALTAAAKLVQEASVEVCQERCNDKQAVIAQMKEEHALAVAEAVKNVTETKQVELEAAVAESKADMDAAVAKTKEEGKAELDAAVANTTEEKK